MHTTFVAAAALLAGAAFASPLVKRAAPATTNPDWEYLGCTEVQPAITFNDQHDWYRDDVGNNIDDCLAYARALGKPYAATFGPFCEVADFANLPLQLSTSSLCNTPCPGNSEQACGQWTGAQQIYKVKGDGINYSTPATLKKQTQADWEYAGCWDDRYGGLFEWPFVQSYQHKNNLETCFTTAAASDRPLVLLDREMCYGHYELMSVAVQIDDALCQVPCEGNPNEYCGTVNALPLYKRRPAPTVEPTDASWSYSGCYTASSNPAVYPYEFRSDEANTATSCMAYARALGKPYAALYGTYCIATDAMGGNAIASTDSLSCKARCPGAVGEACATIGETVLMYKNEALLPTTTSAPVTSTTTTTATTTTATITASPTPTLSPTKLSTDPEWTYQGCSSDLVDGARALPNQLSISGSRTIEACLAAAKKAGYSVAALSYGQECWAGNSVSPYSKPLDASKCKMVCKDNQSMTCGGSGSLDVYFSTVRPVLAGPSDAELVASAAALGYKYDACYSDLVDNKRSLTKSISNPTKTVEGCLAACKKGGYKVCALSYYSECWVGAELSAASTVLPETSCHFPCADNSLEMCGGNKALGVYRVQA
ncbi:hypothetical protein JCM10207_005966 [Rhodosporidiobolus poonsookiae]